MKSKDYFRLARITLKQRKKSTAATVRGLAIGFIILVPLIVSLFGVNLSIKRQLNEAPYLLYGQLNMSDYRIEKDKLEITESDKRTIVGSEHIDFFTDNNDISNMIVYETHLLRSRSGDDNIITLEIEGGKQKVLRDSTAEEYYFSLIDTKKSDTYFPKNLTENYPGGIFIEGMSQGFSNDGKKQVIISERMLKRNGLTAEDVYGKKITLNAENYFYSYENNERNDLGGYICKNYEVVGVIKELVTGLYTSNSSAITNAFMYSDMFFTDVNVYSADGEGLLKPYYEIEAETGWKKTKYNNLEQKDILNEEFMMLAPQRIGFDNNNLTLFSTNIYLEGISFAHLDKAIRKTNNYISKALNIERETVSESAAFARYKWIFEIIRTVSYVFGIVGIIIVLCAIINLYSTIKNSVEGRKFYLTMMRAIGARDKVIPKLYFIESVITISKANIFIATIGFAISAGLKIIIDRVLILKNVVYALGIPWSSIVLCVVMVVIGLYAVGLLFAYLCSYRLSKKPIVTVLKNY